MVPPGPDSGWSSATVRPVTSVPPAPTTTWNDWNSSRAAISETLDVPVTASRGLTFTADPVTTTVAPAALAGVGMAPPTDPATARDTSRKPARRRGRSCDPFIASLRTCQAGGGDGEVGELASPDHLD